MKSEGAASESDSSEYESDDLEIEIPSEPRPRLLEGPRPEAGAQQTEWDAARAVWSPRNKPAIEEGKVQGVTLFAKLVKGIRDSWKAKNDALKEAEAKKEESAIPGLREEVFQQMGLIEIAIKSALDHGHPAYLERYVTRLVVLLPFPSEQFLRLACIAGKIVSVMVGIYVSPVIKVDAPQCGVSDSKSGMHYAA